MGLDYLTLSRAAGTLSGGESQRIRLASQIGSGLTGVLYVLDEPSIGLHQRDNERLLDTLRRLRGLGNSVIVVEHDEDAIRAADYVVDVGPGAGIHGGEIVSAGTPEHIMADPNSLTGQYLTGARMVGVPRHRRTAKDGEHLKIVGARGNNLKDVSIDIPLGTFTCVTGVSAAAASRRSWWTRSTRRWRVVSTDRSSTLPRLATSSGSNISTRSSTSISHRSAARRVSNPATYTGAFTPIRDWFAGLPESKARGYQPGRFSFNVKGGRCEACQGDGVIKIEMHFLPDVYVTCDVCKGKRLWPRDAGGEISRSLDRGCARHVGGGSRDPVPPCALDPGQDGNAVARRPGLHQSRPAGPTPCRAARAQRVKLSKELSRRSTGRTLYILDEPTTGLHFHDVAKLLEVLHELVDQGNTVVVIEHNLEVIKTADYVIDMGPEGGDGGGEVVGHRQPRGYCQVAKELHGPFPARSAGPSPDEKWRPNNLSSGLRRIRLRNLALQRVGRSDLLDQTAAVGSVRAAPTVNGHSENVGRRIIGQCSSSNAQAVCVYYISDGQECARFFPDPALIGTVAHIC